MRFQVTSEALVGALLATSVSAYLSDPPTTASSDTISDCSGWEVAEADSTCDSLAQKWFITAEYFAYYNPSIASKCSLVVGNSYCVEQDWGIPHPIPTPTSSSVPTPPKPSNGVVTPTPIQDGMTENCNKFYTVVQNDGCWAIANAASIDLNDFYKWNPAVKDDCRGLQPKYNVCIGVLGGTQPSPSPTAKPTASSVKPTPTNGVATPSPVQSGIATNCNKFYLVKSGDNCWAISNDNGITTDQFGAWNLALGADCKGLFPNNYVCIGVIGSSGPTPTPTTTVKTTPKPTPTNGINTPSPIQSGMVTNCNKFYLVKSGDGCWQIATDAGITTDQFNAFNPALGADCKGLFPNNYVCVGTIGMTQPTTTTMVTSTKWVMPPLCTFDLSKGEYVCPTAGLTTTRPTTTKPGNGIATPTPVQSGMTGSCKKFYKVVSGDGCWAIANAQGIDLNNFYSWNPSVNTGGECKGLQANVYVCVGV